VDPDLHQRDYLDPDPFQNDNLYPDPHQSDKLDPDLHQFADENTKSTEYEPILAYFSRF